MTDIFFLIVLEARSPWSRCQQGWPLSLACRWHLLAVSLAGFFCMCSLSWHSYLFLWRHQSYWIKAPPFFFFFFLFLLMAAPMAYRGAESELQLLAYLTATATPDLSCICELHHSLWQHGILNTTEWGQGSNPYPHGHYVGFLTLWALRNPRTPPFSFNLNYLFYGPPSKHSHVGG